jgi:hypothetical protein
VVWQVSAALLFRLFGGRLTLQVLSPHPQFRTQNRLRGCVFIHFFLLRRLNVSRL